MDKGIVIDKLENDFIKNNNIVVVCFVEYDIKVNDIICFNVVFFGFENYLNYYIYLDVFCYVDNGILVVGVFIEGLMYVKYGMMDVFFGWLFVLKYVINYVYVRMIVFLKMGY